MKKLPDCLSLTGNRRSHVGFRVGETPDWFWWGRYTTWPRWGRTPEFGPAWDSRTSLVEETRQVLGVSQW